MFVQQQRKLDIPCVVAVIVFFVDYRFGCSKFPFCDFSYIFERDLLLITDSNPFLMLLYAAPFLKQNSAKIFSRQTFLHKHSRDRFSTIYFQYFERNNYHMCTPAVEDGSAESDSFADNVGELGLFAIVRILGQHFFCFER